MIVIWCEKGGKEEKIMIMGGKREKMAKKIRLNIEDTINVVITSKKNLNHRDINKIKDILEKLKKEIEYSNKPSIKTRPIEKVALILTFIGIILTIVFGVVPLL